MSYEPDAATAREDLCRFLSACFYEPVQEFADEHLFDSIRTAAEKVHPDLAEPARKVGEAFAAQDLETLLVDYTRLFLGPMQPLARPYASSWLESSAQDDGAPSLAILDLYEAGGFDVSEDFNDLPDHIAVELEFLYLLTFARNEAEQAGQGDAQTEVEGIEKTFLVDHLAEWIGPFVSAIKEGAETPFYREVAELTELFVRIRAEEANSAR